MINSTSPTGVHGDGLPILPNGLSESAEPAGAEGYGVCTSKNSHANAGHDTHQHEDADVQEYMNRLLGRSSGPKSVEPASVANPQPEPTPAPEEPAVEKFSDHKEFVPRFVAPEKQTNLSALREVANQSNRSAIETSVRKRSLATSHRFLIGTAACIGFGIVFLTLSRKAGDAAMIAACACFIASMVSMGFVLRKRNAGKEPGRSKPNRSKAAQ
jgi:hypothetical protein